MSKQLLKSTAIVGGMTFISRILGFLRDMAAAHFFGASVGYDAFIVASKIPNFMRRLFAEGAFSQAFVPALSEYKTQKTHAEVHQFINRVFGCLSAVLTGVTLAGMLLAPMLVMIFAPGFAAKGASGQRLILASEMLTITFPYLLCISLTAFAGGILNCYGRFAAPAFTPVFLNIMMILAIVWLSPVLECPEAALAWGMLLGGVVQLVFQIPFLKRLNLFPRPQIQWRDPGVRRILGSMVPALLGVSINQLNLMLSSIFASFLPAGSVSWLYYAERLMEFPSGGIGVALATVVLPRLASYHAKSESQSFSSTLDWGVRWVMLIGSPAALGLVLLAGPLLATLFQSGCFTEKDVLSSQFCLKAYAIGIIGFMLVKIFASAYYAKLDVKTPVRIAIIVVVVNSILSAVLMKTLSHAGLALATSVGALLNAMLLGIGLFRRNIYEMQPGWKLLSLQLSLALGAMSFVIIYITPDLSIWFDLPHIQRIVKLFSIIVLAGLAYFGTLFLMGLRVRHLLVKTRGS